MKIEKGHYVPKELITSEALHEAVVKCFVAAGFEDRRPHYGNVGSPPDRGGLCVYHDGDIQWASSSEACKQSLTLQQLFTAENGISWPDWAESIDTDGKAVWFHGRRTHELIAGEIGRGPVVMTLATRQPKEEEVQSEVLSKKLGFIGKYRWGVEYPTNGKRPELLDDVEVEIFSTVDSRWSEGPVRIWNWNVSSIMKFRITDQRYKTDDTSYLNAPTQAQSLTHSEEGLTHSGWWDYENDCLLSRPPVGEVVLLPPKFDEKSQASVVGFFKDETVLYSHRTDSYFGCDFAKLNIKPFDHATRKAELERKVLIEQAYAMHYKCADYEDFCEKLIDAGWRPTK